MKRKIRCVYSDNDSKVQTFVGVSQCIPHQAISVRTAVSMFTRGEKLPPMSVYDTYDEVESDETHPLNRLGIDLDDVTYMRDSQRYKVAEAQRKHREKVKNEKIESDNKNNVSSSKENDVD